MTSTDTQIICAEAPVALVCAAWGIYPLTPCCQAVATGTDDGVACKGCWDLIDLQYGDCWNLDEDRGWSNYKYLVAGAVQVEQLLTVGRTDPREADLKASEVVAYARERAGAVFAQGC